MNIVLFFHFCINFIYFLKRDIILLYNNLTIKVIFFYENKMCWLKSSLITFICCLVLKFAEVRKFKKKKKIL